MSILLTHGYFLHEDEKELKIMRPYPPLGILYLSGYLKEKNIDHVVFDSTFSFEEEWFDYVVKNKPELIAFYTNLMTKVKILSLIEKIKSDEKLTDTKFLIGGPDVTYNIENYMAFGADFLVIGEGEETFYEFINEFGGKQDYAKINGLVFKDDNHKVVRNKPRIKIKDINELTFPNRDSIDLTQYLETWKTHHGKSTLNISTQRGCPYTCQWCSTAVYGQSYRRRSPKLVVDEIENLIKNAIDSMEGKGNINLSITEDALNWLAEISYDVNYGARPIKRMIQKKIVDPLSMYILSDELEDDSAIEIGTDGDGKFTFDKK